jgi:hypothetical protein
MPQDFNKVFLKESVKFLTTTISCQLMGVIDHLGMYVPINISRTSQFLYTLRHFDSMCLHFWSCRRQIVFLARFACKKLMASSLSGSFIRISYAFNKLPCMHFGLCVTHI